MINIFLFTIGFVFMEFVAWYAHKYIMHGLLWKWHMDHHQNDHNPPKEKNSGFEKNDLFFMVFALPAMILISVGFYFNAPALIYTGFGITLYGLVYFLMAPFVT